jgi:hypothetical protein
MSEPITAELIKEMMNADASGNGKQYFPICLSQLMELYDFDEHETCLILKKDITDEPFRYYNVNPYMLLNYELVNQKFMDKYFPYFDALRPTQSWSLIDFKNKYHFN